MPIVGEKAVCAVTGKEFVVTTDGITFNYATNAKGEVFSDEGVHLREVEGLKDRSRPFTCYISGDNDHITGWKGNILGTVVWSKRVLKPRSRYQPRDTFYYSYNIRDVHGGMWYGRSEPGMLINIFPLKDKEKNRGK